MGKKECFFFFSLILQDIVGFTGFTEVYMRSLRSPAAGSQNICTVKKKLLFFMCSNDSVEPFLMKKKQPIR